MIGRKSKYGYVQVTHTYVTPVPREMMKDAEFDSLCNAAVSMMEEHLQKLNPNMRDVVSSWTSMPNEFAPVEETPQTGSAIRGHVPTRAELIEHGREPGQVNFVEDVMGQYDAQAIHPHDQGLHIFPPDHPLRELEDKYLEDREDDEQED